MVVDVVIWLVSLDLVGAVGVAGSLRGTVAVVVFLPLLLSLLLFLSVLVLLLLLLALVLSASSSSMILGRLNFLAIFFLFRCCLLFRLARIPYPHKVSVFRVTLLQVYSDVCCLTFSSITEGSSLTQGTLVCYLEVTPIVLILIASQTELIIASALLRTCRS